MTCRPTIRKGRGAERRASAPWGTISVAIALTLASLSTAPTGGISADRVLVPLELPGRDDLDRILSGLARIEKGELREGVRALQASLEEGLRGADRVGRLALIRVPPELPRDPKRLRESLEEASRDEPAPAAAARPLAPGLRRAQVVVDAGGQVTIIRTQAPTTSEPPAPGRRFLRAPEVAEAALLSLPPAGVAAYRELHDPSANRLLEEHEAGGDRLPLERLARELLLSTPGGAAAELLGDALYEDGDLAGALGWWRKVAEDHPAPGVPRERLRAKALVCLRMLGREREAALQKTILGQGVFEAGLGVEEIERLVPLVPEEDRPPAPTASRWGGELTVCRPPALPGPTLELSWDSWIWSRAGIGASGAEPALRGLFPAETALRSGLGGHFPFVLNVDGDRAYLSGVFSAYLLDARPGGGAVLKEYRKPVSRKLLATYAEQGDSALYTATSWKREWERLSWLEGVPDEVLITPYVVDAVPHIQYRSYDVTVQIPIRGLVAFDARTGAVLWTTEAAASEAAPDDDAGPPGDAPSRVAGPSAPEDPAGGGADDDFQDLEDELDRDASGFFEIPASVAEQLGSNRTAALKGFSYSTPAIVRKGLVVAGGWIQRGYVSAALRALDLRTGRLVWECPIVNSGGVERTLFGELAREPFAGSIAEADGTVYYLTQLGAVAAVELRSGRILWVSTYDTIPVEATYGPRAMLRDVVWGQNPLLLVGNALIATPRDSEFLYAFDAGTGPRGAATAGRILWRYRASDEDRLDGALLRDVVGYREGRLYLAGPTEIAALDLSSMDAEGLLRVGGSPAASPDKKTFAPRTVVRVVGPSVLTDRGIVFSDHDGLRLLGFAAERVEDLVRAPFRKSEWGLYPGRVQVSGRTVLVTSRHLVSAYSAAPAGAVQPRRSL